MSEGRERRVCVGGICYFGGEDGGDEKERRRKKMGDGGWVL